MQWKQTCRTFEMFPCPIKQFWKQISESYYQKQNFNFKFFSIFSSDGDLDPLWKQILIHISGGLDSILIFIEHFLSVLKISKTFVFFIRTSKEYLTRYLPDILKKTKALDIFNTNKKCFIKIDIESSPPEILIRICYHNGSGCPSLIFR